VDIRGGSLERGRQMTNESVVVENGDFHFFRSLYVPSSEPLHSLVAEPETDFNAKWSVKIIQGHIFRCHRRATMGLHSII